MAKTDREKVLEAMMDAQERAILDVLQELEIEIVSVLDDAPSVDGKLSDPNWAISTRVQIEQLMNETFLNKADEIIREYDEAVSVLVSEYAAAGITFALSDEVITVLKRQAFAAFENMATSYANDLANELYANTLAGRPKADSIKNIQQKINGVFMQADEAEVKRLVNIARGTGAKAEEAVELLHNLYATDRVGNNMRRYAKQLVQDTLMEFDGQVTIASAKEAGITKFRYSGDTSRDSRDWCVSHAGRVMTEDEIRDEWANNSWKGKKAGDPFVVAGGYNCVHHWVPIAD